jgi:hypothetical protein
VRTFKLWREKDESGIRGTGFVAEGIEFSDGRCAMRWLAGPKNTHGSVCLYDSIDDLVAIHGHGGSTRVAYLWKERKELKYSGGLFVEGA